MHIIILHTDVVEQIHSIQGSDLTKETTRVVICLLIDPHQNKYKLHGELFNDLQDVYEEDEDDNDNQDQ
ncbi:hypothetical protein YC2023_095583 [Brassica napus]